MNKITIIITIILFYQYIAALIPIYAGRTEEELPSVLRNDPKGRYVDEAYPFIWKGIFFFLFKTIYNLINKYIII